MKPELKRPVVTLMHTWKDNIEMDFQYYRMKLYSGLIWLNIGTSGGLL
jgi:hypothetical protein